MAEKDDYLVDILVDLGFVSADQVATLRPEALYLVGTHKPQVHQDIYQIIVFFSHNLEWRCALSSARATQQSTVPAGNVNALYCRLEAKSLDFEQRRSPKR